MTETLAQSRPVSRVHSADVAAALQNARAVSQKSGARFTRIREHVYRALLEAPGPVGAYEILETVGDVGAQKPPTVYRALDWLMEMGFAHRIATLSKYVAAPREASEGSVAYLLCRQCGQAEAIDAAPLAAPLSDVFRNNGFSRHDAVIEITGLCCKHITKDAIAESVS